MYEKKAFDSYIGAAVEPEFRLKVKIAAAKQDKSISEFIRIAVEKLLNKDK